MRGGGFGVAAAAVATVEEAMGACVISGVDDGGGLMIPPPTAAAGCGWDAGAGGGSMSRPLGRTAGMQAGPSGLVSAFLIR